MCIRDYVTTEERLKSLEHRKKIKICYLLERFKWNALIKRLQQKDLLCGDW